MKTYFADTSFFIAFLVSEDEYHDQAVRMINQLNNVITTSGVLTELANSLSKPPGRETFIRFLEYLITKPFVTIVHITETLFEQGLDLYSRRLDKDWSLTDCISFVVMQERGLTEALTGDRHFEQAGFKALLA